MSRSRKLALPDEFPYLGRQYLRYRVVELTEESVTISRSKGQTKVIPVDFIFKCYNDLMAAPARTLPLQEIVRDTADSIRFGESIIGATLVAAGLAKVVSRGPIKLLGVQKSLNTSGAP